METLLDAVREAAGGRVWGAAVKLARDGGVLGVSDDGEEVRLRVKAPGKLVWHDVYLWPADPDWGCDCELPGEACVHVAAATIALQKSRNEGDSLPAPAVQHKVRIRYDFTSAGEDLSVSRIALYADGSMERVTGALASLDLVVDVGDAQAETLLALHGGGALTADLLRNLLSLLPESA